MQNLAQLSAIDYVVNAPNHCLFLLLLIDELHAH